MIIINTDRASAVPSLLVSRLWAIKHVPSLNSDVRAVTFAYVSIDFGWGIIPRRTTTLKLLDIESIAVV